MTKDNDGPAAHKDYGYESEADVTEMLSRLADEALEPEPPVTKTALVPNVVEGVQQGYREVTVEDE